MAVAVLVVAAALVALVAVLVAAHKTKPDRISVGVHTKWGVIGVQVERPFYAEQRRDQDPPPPALS